MTGIIPEPQKVWRFPGRQDPFTLSEETIIVLDQKAGPLLAHGAEVLQNDLNRVFGLKVPVIREPLGDANLVALTPKGPVKANNSFDKLSSAVKGLPIKGDESYRLAVDPRMVLIVSPAEAGTFYGIQTLRQMLRRDRTIPSLVIADWPERDRRIMSCHSMPYMPEMMVDKMARLKINTCIVESRWYAGGNWWYNPNAKNRGESEKFFELCRQNNIEPIPYVQGLGWAYGVVDINPSCAEGIWVQNESHKLTGTNAVNFNNPNVLCTPSAPITVTNLAGTKTFTEGKDYQITPGLTERPFDPANRPWKIARKPGGAIGDGQEVLVSYNYMDNATPRFPYCPCEPLTYKTVDETLTYVINTFHPRYLHIGHDEVDYVGRCSRCRQYKQANKKTDRDLIIKDLTYWFKKIKSLDPKITILMCDDLARPNAQYGSVIDAIPQDVIIHTWVYEDTTEVTELNGKPGELGEAGVRGDQAIANRLEWFIAKNHHKTLGLAAGFYPWNNWLWKEAVEKYRSDPNCLGYAYGVFNQLLLPWSCLGLSAQGMWSPHKLPKDVFDLYVQADRICRGREIGVTMPMEDQRLEIAKLVEQTGSGTMKVAASLESAISALKQKFKARILPELADDLIAPGSDPERVGIQLDAYAAYFRAMALYGQAQKSLAAGNKTETLARLVEIKNLLIAHHLPEYRTAPLWLARYQKDNQFPSAITVFGMDLKPAK